MGFGQAAGGGEGASALGGMTLAGLLRAIAAKSPAPGGGAVAGAVGALGAALAEMVVAYSLGRRDLAAHQSGLSEAQRRLARARGMFLALADDDAEAYGRVNELMRLPEGDPRRGGLAAAVEAAVTAPMSVLALAAELAALCLGLQDKTNPRLVSDLEIAGVLAHACARSAWCNVRVNAPMLADQGRRAAVLREAAGLVRLTGERCAWAEAGAGAAL